MAGSGLPEMPAPEPLPRDPRPFAEVPQEKPQEEVPVAKDEFPRPDSWRHKRAKLPSNAPDQDRRLSRVIKATDPGADKLQVYNSDTGVVVDLVQRVCVAEGWLERFIRRDDGTFVWDEKTREFKLERLYGPWAIRPRGSAQPNLGRALEDDQASTSSPFTPA